MPEADTTLASVCCDFAHATGRISLNGDTSQGIDNLSPQIIDVDPLKGGSLSLAHTKFLKRRSQNRSFPLVYLQKRNLTKAFSSSFTQTS